MLPAYDLARPSRTTRVASPQDLIEVQVNTIQRSMIGSYVVHGKGIGRKKPQEKRRRKTIPIKTERNEEQSQLQEKGKHNVMSLWYR
jgi:acetamidase/formamidase